MPDRWLPRFRASTRPARLRYVFDGEVVQTDVSYCIVTFSEPLSQALVQNVKNWSLTLGGKTLAGSIVNVQYGLNEAYILGLTSTPSGKYEAVVTFDSDSATAGNQSLTSGSYTLSILKNVQDLFGNQLDGGYTGIPGTNYTLAFTIAGGGGGGGGGDIGDNTTPPGPPTPGTGDLPVNTFHTTLTDGILPDVATDAIGDYVVAWVTNHYNEIVQDSNGQTVYGSDIAVQLFNKNSELVGTEFTVNPHTKTTDTEGNTVYTPNGIQTEPAVAMDAFGDFVVVWAGDGTQSLTGDGSIVDLGDDAGIFAQVYDKSGKAVGDAFRVNQTVLGIQDQPDVAMDADGDFVISWTSTDSRSPAGGIYARRFNVQGAAVTNEVAVSPADAAARQENSAVAIDGNANFTVVWQSDDPAWEICGQQFSAAGIKRGGEMAINTYTQDKQNEPAIAMDPAGDFVVAWQSFGQDGSGYGVYARRYTPAGVAKDAQEFRVNVTTTNWQMTPDVAMASNG